MESLIIKIRIAVLWIFMAVAIPTHAALFFMEPGAVEEIKEMALGPGMMLFMTLLWLVPSIMAFLSLTLRDTMNQWANLVMGGVFTILNLGHLFEHLIQPSVHQLLIVGSTVIVAALIVWYTWKWKTQQA